MSLTYAIKWGGDRVRLGERTPKYIRENRVVTSIRPSINRFSAKNKLFSTLRQYKNQRITGPDGLVDGGKYQRCTINLKLSFGVRTSSNIHIWSSISEALKEIWQQENSKYSLGGSGQFEFLRRLCHITECLQNFTTHRFKVGMKVRSSGQYIT